ncbi:MAG: metallophosphoesterase [Candidatus Heimdallarchaeota archaeon]
MDRAELIALFLKHGFNVTGEVLDYLRNISLSKSQMNTLVSQLPQEVPVVTVPVIQEALMSTQHRPEISKGLEMPSTNDSISIRNSDQISTQQKSHISTPKQPPSLPEIVIDLDIPTSPSDPVEVDTFRDLFLDRFQRLSRIIRDQLPDQGLVLGRNLTIEEVPLDKSGILIGMVQDTGVLHTGKFVIQLEDPNDEMLTRCVMVQESTSFSGYHEILRDTVIGVEGDLPKKYEEGAITAFWGKDVIRPSLTPIRFQPNPRSGKILFLADIHFGAKSFATRAFANLLKLVQLDDLPPNLASLAQDIKVVIVAGDLCDGVGQFPDQQANLSVSSLQAQYDGLSGLFSKIPSYIQIIVIPGEHDATQIALPQPAIDREIGNSIFSLPNVLPHGNPLRVTIDGLNLLVYHGQGIEQLDPINPISSIQQLLEYRHLAPEYGVTIPLVPAKRDYLVIDRVPEVLVVGHSHQASVAEYKGVKIIACGTFQGKGPDHLKISQKTSVGVVHILDIHTGQIATIDLRKMQIIPS